MSPVQELPGKYANTIMAIVVPGRGLRLLVRGDGAAEGLRHIGMKKAVKKMLARFASHGQTARDIGT